MSKKIFLVDDSATMLMSLRNTLQIGGFEVETAGDGEAALQRLQGGYKPDLMITDINMPKLDGLALIRETRRLLRFMPILALTTESQQHKRDEAKRNGATGWMVKPVGGNDLLALIRQVLPGT